MTSSKAIANKYKWNLKGNLINVDVNVVGIDEPVVFQVYKTDVKVDEDLDGDYLWSEFIKHISKKNNPIHESTLGMDTHMMFTYMMNK